MNKIWIPAYRRLLLAVQGRAAAPHAPPAAETGNVVCTADVVTQVTRFVDGNSRCARYVLQMSDGRFAVSEDWALLDGLPGRLHPIEFWADDAKTVDEAWTQYRRGRR